MSWSNTPLCTRTDLENEIGDLTTFVQVTESEQDNLVTLSMATAKKLITDKLSASLPEIFVSSVGQYTNLQFGDWITQRGYSYTDLDTILDELANPEVLNSAAVALSIVCLTKRAIAQNNAMQNVNVPVMADQREYWQEEFERRFKDGKKQLKFDLSGDGIIQDFERTRTHINFFRS